MQKTNMNLSNGIDAEMLMEWGMSLMEIAGDFAGILKALVPPEEKRKDDNNLPLCNTNEEKSDSARAARLLSYLGGILETAENDDEWDDEDWNDDDLDDENQDDALDEGDESGRDAHGWFSEVETSTLVMVMDPADNAAILPWKEAKAVYPGLFRDCMELVCFDKEAGLCFVRSGVEYVPDGRNVCVRGPVIVLKIVGGTPKSLNTTDILRIVEYFDRLADSVGLPGGNTVAVFNLWKGENHESE